MIIGYVFIHNMVNFSRFVSLHESYCSSNSLIVDINDDFPLFASWFEMCKKVCLAMLVSGSDSKSKQNFSMSSFVTGYNIWCSSIQAQIIFVKLYMKSFNRVLFQFMGHQAIIRPPPPPPPPTHTSELYNSIGRDNESKSLLHFVIGRLLS